MEVNGSLALGEATHPCHHYRRRLSSSACAAAIFRGEISDASVSRCHGPAVQHDRNRLLDLVRVHSGTIMILTLHCLPDGHRLKQRRHSLHGFRTNDQSSVITQVRGLSWETPGVLWRACDHGAKTCERSSATPASNSARARPSCTKEAKPAPDTPARRRISTTAVSRVRSPNPPVHQRDARGRATWPRLVEKTFCSS